MVLTTYIVYKIAKLHEEYMEKYPGNDGREPISEKDIEELWEYINDPLRAELRKTINGLSKEEKDELMALMYFGRETDYKTAIDFEFMKKQITHDGDFDTENMIAKTPLAKYLRTGLRKLQVK